MKTDVDLILHNAVIYTVNKDFRIAEALAVKGNRIVDVGTNRSILEEYNSTYFIDAKNDPVYPGFIDAHCHIDYYAQSLQIAKLEGTQSWDEVLDQVQDFATSNTFPWVIGRNWDQNNWQVQRTPDNNQLNTLFPDIPVLLYRVDTHAAIANRAALNRAGISIDQAIKGGEIQTRDGKLTGLLIDNAIDLVESEIPEKSDAEKKKYLLKAQENCFAVGLTTIDDCGLSKEKIEFIDSLQKKGALKIRIYAMASDEPQNYDYYLQAGPYKTDRLNVRAFKLFSDGALGSRGARLLEPYSDSPNKKGFFLKDRAYFEQIAKLLIDSDFQMVTHAIGDAANRMMLQIYGQVLKKNNDLRWRIEHAQILKREDVQLFSKYNIIPSVQPTHATSDMYWAEKRLGKIG